MLNQDFINQLNKIQFLERFEYLSNTFHNNQSSDIHNIDKLLGVLKSYNNNFKFDKKELFYGLQENIGHYLFTLNLSLRFGVVEIIFFAKDNFNNNQYGGPLSHLIKQLQLGEESERTLSFTIRDFQTMMN